MSTKSRKTGPVPGTSRGSPRKSQTPQPQGNPSSPLSPTKYTRLQEKEDLANLNDRLACYIDRVRNLETENSRLTREVKTSQENVSREVTQVKTMYESELNEARKLLDELSREKAKLQIDTRRLYTENEELRTELDKKTKDNNILQTSLSVTESKLQDALAKVNALVAEKRKLLDDFKEIEQERNRLLATVAETRKLLEEETLQRVDMENSLQTTREELAFKEQLHEQQLHETRTKRQVEITEIDGRLSQEYEERLLHALQEIRDQYEEDLENNKEEVRKIYDEKLRNLNSQLSRSGNAANMAMNELRAMQVRVEELNRRVKDLENERNSAVHSAREIERQYEQAKSNFMEEYAKQEREMTLLRDQMAQQAQEYQDLMDIKIALDLEIAAYRKLLEGEEARLNITPVSSPGRATPRKTLKGKRKRTFIEESDETDISNFSVTSSTKCEISISEVDPEGKFVKLTNKSGKEVALGGWQLTRKAGESSNAYKFHRTIKVEPGATVTIWSADVPDKTHEPPENLVMKGQRWVIADSMTTKLLNSSGEEMAIAEHKKQHISDKSSMRQQEGSSFYSKRPFFGSSSRSSAEAQGEERCAIM